MDGRRDSGTPLTDFDEIWTAEPSSRDRPRGRGGLVAFLIVVAVIILGGGGYVTWALTAPVASPDLVVAAPPAPTSPPAELALPATGAAIVSVSGGEPYLGPDAAGTWAATGGDEARPLASITKLITALVVLDAVPLDGPDDAGPTLTFDAADEDLYDEYYVQGATIARMPVNSSLSLRDALTVMLVPSASNYAEAIARWAFGSDDGFVAATRAWLAENGLTSTTIVEPTGISPRNTSTPSDLLALGRIAAADPTVSAIAAMRSVSLPDIGYLANTNGLLGRDGVTGVKTGNLGAGSFSLLFTAALDVGIGSPLQVTGATMGGESRGQTDAAVLALLDSIRAGFHPVAVAAVDREIGTITTPWGSSAKVVMAQNASILTWSDTPITVTLDTHDPQAYADGEVIGELTWTAGPNEVKSGVKISGAIEPPTALWRLTHPGNLGG